MAKKKRTKEETEEINRKIARQLDYEATEFIKDIKSDECMESCMDKVKEFTEVWWDRGAEGEMQRVIDALERMDRRDLVFEIAAVLLKDRGVDTPETVQ